MRKNIITIKLFGFGFTLALARTKDMYENIEKFHLDYEFNEFSDWMIRFRFFYLYRLLFYIHLNRGV